MEKKIKVTGVDESHSIVRQLVRVNLDFADLGANDLD